MKKIAVMLISILLLILCSISTFAEGEIWYPDLEAEMSPEFREVLKSIFWEEKGGYGEDYARDSTVMEYENAIKLQGVTTPTIMTDYMKKKGAFSTFISENPPPRWYVPVWDATRGRHLAIIIYDTVERRYEIIGHRMEVLEFSPSYSGTGITLDPVFIELFDHKSMTEKYGEGFEVVVLPRQYGGLTMVYYVKDKVEYLVPYESKALLLPYEVKKAYTPEKLFSEWSEKYKEVEVKNEGAGGTGEYKLVERDGTEFEWSSWMTVSIAVLALALGVVGIIVYLKKKERTE